MSVLRFSAMVSTDTLLIAVTVSGGTVLALKNFASLEDGTTAANESGVALKRLTLQWPATTDVGASAI